MIQIIGYDGISDNGQEIYNFLEQEGRNNVVLMGVLARYLPVDPAVWEATIRKNMPEKLVEMNLQAFGLGWDQVSPEY